MPCVGPGSQRTQDHNSIARKMQAQLLELLIYLIKLILRLLTSDVPTLRRYTAVQPIIKLWSDHVAVSEQMELLTLALQWISSDTRLNLVGTHLVRPCQNSPPPSPARLWNGNFEVFA